MPYGLAAVATDKEALGTVQAHVVQAILKKLHVQSTIPTSIRHSPSEFGGLELHDRRTESGIESVKKIGTLYTRALKMANFFALIYTHRKLKRVLVNLFRKILPSMFPI